MRTVAERDQENISQITSQVAELQEVNTQLREVRLTPSKRML